MMIIVHSTGEEVTVLCTSTIIFSYLVNYLLTEESPTTDLYILYSPKS